MRSPPDRPNGTSPATGPLPDPPPPRRGPGGYAPQRTHQRYTERRRVIGDLSIDEPGRRADCASLTHFVETPRLALIAGTRAPVVDELVADSDQPRQVDRVARREPLGSGDEHVLGEVLCGGPITDIAHARVLINAELNGRP